MKNQYIEFQDSEVWKIIEKVLLDLEANQDLKIKTLKEYVVGYICQQLFENKIVIQTIDSEKGSGSKLGESMSEPPAIAGG